MMNILEKIIAHKQQEIAERKELFPIRLLEQRIYFDSKTVSLSRYLQREDLAGIIAEYKRKSPSKGTINEYADVEKVSIGYMQAGASALSVLTDTRFFGGKNEDLTLARKFNFCPILRKDFIIDEYQLVEAKSIGADVVLLIAAVLTPEQTKTLAEQASKLGLEVLLEVHNRQELKTHLNEFINVVGVNNRNLENFEVSTAVSEELAPHIPDDFVKVSESGLRTPDVIVKLRKAGFQGFLMGEHFMQSGSPHGACADFIKEVKRLEADAGIAEKI